MAGRAGRRNVPDRARDTMLTALVIRNYVLIDRLEIEFGSGLCVLTGETGAGKSILLDALGLATGARAESSATGAGEDARAMVAATFDIPDGHPVRDRLVEQDIDLQPGEPLVLRRTVTVEGRSRAFVNDQPVSVAALRSVGELLVEIEGQYARHGLLDRTNHRAALDAFGGHGDLLDAARNAWDELDAAETGLSAAREDAERLESDGDYLRHAHHELSELDPRPGEEGELAQARTVMMNSEKIAEAVEQGILALDGDDGVRDRLGGMLRIVERANTQAAGLLGEALEALERAVNEAEAVSGALDAARAGMERDPGRLQELDERLFALRGLARKHDTDVDSLAGVRERIAARLALLDDSGHDIAKLEKRVEGARKSHTEKAEKLSAARKRAAAALDRAVAAELPDLQLPDARFTTVVAPRAAGGRDGVDDVGFEISSNPGQEPGPLSKVASGGELARVLLALRVALLRTTPVDTLIFDEVDAGIGGAAASAVAERLNRLTEEAQVLVVTHSPQVAARGGFHLQVRKSVTKRRATTEVSTLSPADRREEIARMLAGAEITDEARAAAGRLMAEGG